VCAANFGDICSVVGQQATEEMLLPRFFQLCSDNVWGVRKACAECFMAVSCATCQEIRRTKLSALFINLISDPSRWVRQAAFQSLGPFISTFANPSSSGQYFKEESKSSEDTSVEDKNRYDFFKLYFPAFIACEHIFHFLYFIINFLFGDFAISLDCKNW